MAIYTRMKAPPDCRDWITCLQQGEGKALAHFFDLFHQGIYEYSFEIVQNGADAKDIAQESFMKLWAARATINDETHVRNSLYLYARQLSLMVLRKRNKQRQREGEFNYLSLAQNANSIGTPDPDMEVAMTAYSHLDQLIIDIEGLAPGCREVFRLYYLEKKTTREIAAQLQLSPQTVLNQKTRARNRLKELFQRRELHTLLIFIFLWLNR